MEKYIEGKGISAAEGKEIFQGFVSFSPIVQALHYLHQLRLVPVTHLPSLGSIGKLMLAAFWVQDLDLDQGGKDFHLALSPIFLEPEKNIQRNGQEKERKKGMKM